MTSRTNRLIAAAALVMAASIGSVAAFNRTQAPSVPGGSPLVFAQSKMIHPKSSLSKRARLNRATRINRVPGALANASSQPVAILKEDCQFTNDGISQCLVWDCDDDDVCVEYGQYCVDGDKVIPCP